MGKAKWPTPDNPYREDVTFQDHGGQEIVDGKAYYPTLLRLRLRPDQALRLAEDLIRESRLLQHELDLLIGTTHDPERIIRIDLSGELKPTGE